MEMSLDDIIKQNKISRARGGRGPGSFRGSSKKPGGGVIQVIRGRDQGGIFRRNQNSSPRYKPRASLPPKKFTAVLEEPTRLIVLNLDFVVSDADILDLFSNFGKILNLNLKFGNKIIEESTWIRKSLVYQQDTKSRHRLG